MEMSLLAGSIQPCVPKAPPCPIRAIFVGGRHGLGAPTYARPSHPHSRSSHSHRGRDAERVELDDRIAVRDQRDRAGNGPSAIKRSMLCGIKERMGSPVCWHRPSAATGFRKQPICKWIARPIRASQPIGRMTLGTWVYLRDTGCSAVQNSVGNGVDLQLRTDRSAQTGAAGEKGPKR